MVGAGVAGASAAFHLSRQPSVRDVYVLEAGAAGYGSAVGKPLVDHAVLLDGDVIDALPHCSGGNSMPAISSDVVGSGLGSGAMSDKVFTFARSSGTAVYPNPEESAIKMIVNIFPCSCESYIAHHGEAGARSYLRLAFKGLELQKKIARELLGDSASEQLTCLGSLYVCLEEDIDEFKREFRLLQTLGARDVEWWGAAQVQASAGPAFSRGIFFPHDAVIDSASYAKALLRAAIATGKVKLVENCSPVAKVATTCLPAAADGGAGAGTGGPESTRALAGRVELQDGTIVTCDWVVLATGGLFPEPSLAGVLTPCWSYLVSIPEPAPTAPVPAPATTTDIASTAEFRLQSPNSPNFFTWRFTHDWCLTKGHLRCSGEDHYSALKPPRAEQRCRALAQWTVNTLPYLLPSETTTLTTTTTTTTTQQTTTMLVSEQQQQQAVGPRLDGLQYSARYGVYSETPDCSPLVGPAHPDSRVCYLLGCNAWGQALFSYTASLVPTLLGLSPASQGRSGAGALVGEDAEDFRVLDVRRYALLDAVISSPC